MSASQPGLLPEFAKIVETVTEGDVSAAGVQAGSSLIDDLDLDSLHMAEISEIIRDTWGVMIPLDTVREFHTVDEVLTAIAAKLALSASGGDGVQGDTRP